MRLKGRQLRFLVATLGCWVGARAYMLWPVGERPVVRVARVAKRRSTPVSETVRAEPVEAQSLPLPLPKERASLRQARPEPREAAAVPAILAMAEPGIATPSAPDREDRAAPPPPTANPLLATASRPREWEGETYVFVRPSSAQAALAAGGQLGGSQVAARVAWRPGGGIVGLALRGYAPLGGKGAEAAVGIDLHPFRTASLRLSVERRQRIDAQGRSAWSAYAAGGFYRGGRPGRFEADGYAQAGVVGAQRRDLFVDGALRGGYRFRARRIAPILGAGLWGAAQPGVARLDIGPRAVLRVPVGGHLLSAALDGRFRLAGEAAPNSGAAFTLAADF